MVIPTYVFVTPFLGGQASVSMIAGYGGSSASLNGTVAGSITGPLGNAIPFGPRFDSINSSVTGFTDLIPQPALRWNKGVDNYMVYAAFVRERRLRHRDNRRKRDCVPDQTRFDGSCERCRLLTT